MLACDTYQKLNGGKHDIHNYQEHSFILVSMHNCLSMSFLYNMLKVCVIKQNSFMYQRRVLYKLAFIKESY